MHCEWGAIDFVRSNLILMVDEEVDIAFSRRGASCRVRPSSSSGNNSSVNLEVAMYGTLGHAEMGSCTTDGHFSSPALFHHRNSGVYEAQAFIDIGRRTCQRIWGIWGRRKRKQCCALVWVMKVIHAGVLVVVDVSWLLSECELMYWYLRHVFSFYSGKTSCDLGLLLKGRKSVFIFRDKLAFHACCRRARVKIDVSPLFNENFTERPRFRSRFCCSLPRPFRQNQLPTLTSTLPFRLGSGNPPKESLVFLIKFILCRVYPQKHSLQLISF